MSETLSDVGREFHQMLHKLWSKAGTTYYDKQDWRRLEAAGYKLMRACGVESPYGLSRPGDRVE